MKKIVSRDSVTYLLDCMFDDSTTICSDPYVSLYLGMLASVQLGAYELLLAVGDLCEAWRWTYWVESKL